jgi:hypothetical protein
MELKEIYWGKCEVDSFSSAKRLAVGPHGHGNEPSSSIEGREFLE